MKTFEEFKIEKTFFEEASMNEGLFTKLTSMFSKFIGVFKDPMKVNQGVDRAMEELGAAKTTKFVPKQAKPNESFMVKMGDPKNPKVAFTMALTKLSDLPDGSGLFQISGTTSPEMLKVLTGTNKTEDLAKNNVMAIISVNGLVKGQPATMRLLKNVIPGDKDYVTKTFVEGVVPSLNVEKSMTMIKK